MPFACSCVLVFFGVLCKSELCLFYFILLWVAEFDHRIIFLVRRLHFQTFLLDVWHESHISSKFCSHSLPPFLRIHYAQLRYYKKRLFQKSSKKKEENNKNGRNETKNETEKYNKNTPMGPVE